MNGAERLSRRRWRFAGCLFDETNWTLVVDGRRVYVEAKPLELLRELLLKAGNVVTKDELLDNIWPGLHVVEASLPTAVGKLRKALRDDRHEIIETVPGIGYRIPGEVELDDGSTRQVANRPVPETSLQVPAPAIAANKPAPAFPSLMSVAGGIAIVLAGLAVAIGPSRDAGATRTHSYTKADVAEAFRKLDVEAVDRMIAAGWDPTLPWDKEGDSSLDFLLNVCEWDKAHDRRQMLLIARSLLEAGVEIDQRNIYGDTPYSIAKAPRYCGPDHPVTQMLEAMCYGGDVGPKDRCLATYELSPAQRKAQGLPPKG